MLVVQLLFAVQLIHRQYLESEVVHTRKYLFHWIQWILIRLILIGQLEVV